MNRREVLTGAFLVLAGAGGTTYVLDDDSDASSVAAVSTDNPSRASTPPPTQTPTPTTTPEKNLHDGEAVDGKVLTECDDLSYEFMFANLRDLDDNPTIHVRLRVTNTGTATIPMKATGYFFDGETKLGNGVDGIELESGESDLADVFLHDDAERAETFRIRLTC